MATKKKKTGLIESITELSRRFGKAVTVLVSVAGVSFTIGYKTAEVFKEREIISIENRHSQELLKQKEDYLDKFYELKEQQILINKNDTTDGRKEI